MAADKPDMKLVPASQFTLEELAEAYNLARVDYIVPMKMDAVQLQAYLRIYDVILEQSVVAVEGDQILGLGMLGVRKDRAWITRLGVIPHHRRSGSGGTIVKGLLANAERLGASRVVLEMIQGNEPARALFHQIGFKDTRELLVLRRPAGMPPEALADQVSWLGHAQALEAYCLLLPGLDSLQRPAWTNEVESMQNGGDCIGLRVEMPDGSSGWGFFRRQEELLSHFVFHTTAGDPEVVSAAVLSHVYRRFPGLDTCAENLPACDPHLPVMYASGFVEVFRRMEMERIP